MKPKAILKREKEVIGIPLKLIDKTGRLKTGKRAVGTTIEENRSGYTPNSESGPDFPEAGVELKATPIILGLPLSSFSRSSRRMIMAIQSLSEPYLGIFLKETLTKSSRYGKGLQRPSA